MLISIQPELPYLKGFHFNLYTSVSVLVHIPHFLQYKLPTVILRKHSFSVVDLEFQFQSGTSRSLSKLRWSRNCSFMTFVTCKDSLFPSLFELTLITSQTTTYFKILFLPSTLVSLLRTSYRFLYNFSET